MNRTLLSLTAGGKSLYLSLRRIFPPGKGDRCVFSKTKTAGYLYLRGTRPSQTQVRSKTRAERRDMEQNYKLTISYDGSRYFGWEHQKSTENTIQGKLETVLARMLLADREEREIKAHCTDSSKETAQTEALPAVSVTGAGRTDAGVHAKAMIASVRLDTPRSEAEIQDYMNRYLPEDISVDGLRRAAERFHARYSAVGKTYCYSCYAGNAKPVFERKYLTLLEQMPDVSRMREAAALLTGTHDFRSFCGNPRMKKSTVRTVDSIEIRVSGPYLRMYFHGNGFLQHMVRILSGTLLEVGFGKRSPEEMSAILAARDRTAAGYTAPAQGLCLIRVDY